MPFQILFQNVLPLLVLFNLSISSCKFASISVCWWVRNLIDLSRCWTLCVAFILSGISRSGFDPDDPWDPCLSRESGDVPSRDWCEMGWSLSRGNGLGYRALSRVFILDHWGRLFKGGSCAGPPMSAMASCTIPCFIITSASLMLQMTTYSEKL